MGYERFGLSGIQLYKDTSSNFKLQVTLFKDKFDNYDLPPSRSLIYINYY
jgi:hypothetical protein